MPYEVFLVNVSRESVEVQLPIWLTVLVNALKLQGIEPQVVDLVPVAFDQQDEFFCKSIPEKPVIIGFSIMAGNDHINQVEHFAKMAKNINPNHIIIYGGALPSSTPELLLEKCVCEYILVGEGELSFPVLIRFIQKENFYPEDVAGLYYKKDGMIIGNKHNRMVVDSVVDNVYQLSELSRSDYSFLEIDFYINYLRETGQSFEIMGSRGCKGSCFFCHKLVQGLGVKSPNAILDEMSEIIERYNFNRFYFIDENFLNLKSIFRKFLEKKQSRKMDFSFIGQSRIDLIDEDICAWGRDNGLSLISMGIESVNQRTIDKMGKGIKVNDAEEKFQLLRKYGIRIATNFIIGFPWDTENDYVEMINFIKRNGLEKQGKVSYLSPLPGTRIWKDCIRKGQIKDEWEFIKNLGNLYFERMINITNLTDEILDHYYQEITDLVRKPVVIPESLKYREKLSHGKIS